MNSDEAVPRETLPEEVARTGEVTDDGLVRAAQRAVHGVELGADLGAPRVAKDVDMHAAPLVRLHDVLQQRGIA